jgi:RHS repeat-associated protein
LISGEEATNTYTWNARNQLTQVSQNGVAQLSYAYDALGRRTSKTVSSGAPTQFLYDGQNAVQETVGSAINPILIGPGIDERYARNDVGGRAYFLSDALNSTIALTSSTGAIQNQYSYDPYGNVTASNATFTNPYQFMGREADAPGLYYYRARYYSPMMAGFISEDPIGFAGGQLSFYAAFGSDPLDYVDPFGLARITGVPGNAVQYRAGDGALFYAPPQANWDAVNESGYINGPDPVGINAAVGHYGMYDFQRSGGDFYTQYTPASNYAVGAFMEGAGFSLDATTFIGETFAKWMSSNAGDPNQKAWWKRGWCDAYNNSLAKPFNK